MKKIFSVICAVFVAVVIPFAFVGAPTLVKADDVVGEGYPVYRLTGGGEYVFDENLPSYDNSVYMSIDVASFSLGANYSASGIETQLPQYFILNYYLDCIPFNEQRTTGDIYRGSSTGAPIFVQSSVPFRATVVASARSSVDGFSFILFAVPSAIPVDTEQSLFTYAPSSSVGLYDLYFVRYNSNTNVSYYYYIPWVFTRIGDFLYATTFVYENYIVSYMPFIAMGYQGTVLRCSAGVYECVTDSNFDIMPVVNNVYRHSASFNNVTSSNYLSLRLYGSRTNSSGIPIRDAIYSPLISYYDSSLSFTFSPRWGYDFFRSKYSAMTNQVFDNAVSSYQDGYNAGYDYGRSVGNSQGYDQGYNQGYNDGKADGLELSGIANIRAQEYNRGFMDGLRRAEQNGGAFGFVSLLTTIADSQLTLLTGFLDFNFLGFNMLTFFKSLLTVCIVIMIIKFII